MEREEDDVPDLEWNVCADCSKYFIMSFWLKVEYIDTVFANRNVRRWKFDNSSFVEWVFCLSDKESVAFFHRVSLSFPPLERSPSLAEAGTKHSPLHRWDLRANLAVLCRLRFAVIIGFWVLLQRFCLFNKIEIYSTVTFSLYLTRFCSFTIVLNRRLHIGQLFSLWIIYYSLPTPISKCIRNNMHGDNSIFCPV